MYISNGVYSYCTTASVPNLIRQCSLDDPGIPPELREIPGPPETLWVRGTLPPLSSPRVAIVGTRKATAEGRAVARELARELAERSVVVVSGLALGIDAAAHEGALAGNGVTVAVLGNGVDQIYPPSHGGLARRILERGGCLCSEYPPGTPALPHHFLARNRIVSGLCRGIVIIEAPARSGTLATARHALEQGREVFVLPGPARHPNFTGSHRLIRDGARLVAGAADILEDLGIAEPPAGEAKVPEPANDAQRKIFDALRAESGPLSLDALAEAAGLPGNVASAEAATLVIAGTLLESGRGFMLR